VNGYYYETIIGRIGIVENGHAITHLFFNEIDLEDINLIETPLLKKAHDELQEYLDGDRKEFDLPLELSGTEFQKKVWNALMEIPYGQTKSYKDIAERIGNIKACRAVGMANNKNPIAIFVPCHRVIGSNGKLVGYGGGLDIKERLLELESRTGEIFNA
jgi:methylated-DNA-[protein]-cysteine S-methyltransferase